FRHEARAASALNHPNIVTIHEIGETDSLHFIATEFVDGETLREHMTNTRMAVSDVLDVACHVASALQAAHEKGIVHRDIKPENLMLRRDRVVKVLDFGLAKLTAQELVAVDGQGLAQSMVQTNPGVVMGTVGYMSPEQARGHEVDARTDIWSLGVVLYEMVAGCAPFVGETPSHVIVSVLESQPLPLSGVPAELEQIVRKALRKDREERYQTASELGHDLKKLKEELAVEARLKMRPKVSGKEFAARSNRFKSIETVLKSAARTVQMLPAHRTVNVLVTRHKTLAGAAFLVLLAAVIGGTYYATRPSKTDVVARSKKSIAVLPLKPLNAADRDDIYELGIADSLIHRLSSMNGFFVRPLSATRKYANLEQDPLAAGKEQQVDYVLASNYQVADGRIGITAQLVNVESGLVEESYKLEKDSANVLAIQDAIAVEIGNKLLARFDTTSNHLTAKRGTANEEAYRLYLQGMYLANNRTLADSRKAVEALKQAVLLDSNYARAWAGLAYAYRTVSLYPGSGMSTEETYQSSLEAIDNALVLDQNLSEAHSALCENKYLYEWDFAGAERECKLAIALNPDSSQAHEIYSRYLMGRQRHAEAIAEIQVAIDLEPTSRFAHRNYGRSLLYARRYPEAATQFKRVIAMDPNFVGTYSFLTSTLALQGNESEAFEWLLKLLSVRKVDEKTVQALKTAFQRSGWHGVLREWVKRIEQVGGSNFDSAAYYAQLGDKDKAFEYLEKIYQGREIWMTYLEVDPRLDGLRGDPRFDELVRRVEWK
ncbi:MAG TPA: protein kinase, partial [Pyrinomonadaceae bacterium]|nr:protein kinase [Pyrinomonadaceae bacterium]